MDFGRCLIMNRGSLFLVVTPYPAWFRIHYLARRRGDTSLGQKCQAHPAEPQLQGAPLDVSTTSCTEITFACALNFMMSTTKGESPEGGVLLNNIFLVLAPTAGTGYPNLLPYMVTTYHRSFITLYAHTFISYQPTERHAWGFKLK